MSTAEDIEEFHHAGWSGGVAAVKWGIYSTPDFSLIFSVNILAHKYSEYFLHHGLGTQ
jgi:hypothetical protein